VSAKTGEGVGNLFEEICRDLVKTSNIRKASMKSTRLDQKDEGGKSKKSCC